MEVFGYRYHRRGALKVVDFFHLSYLQKMESCHSTQREILGKSPMWSGESGFVANITFNQLLSGMIFICSNMALFYFSCFR